MIEHEDEDGDNFNQELTYEEIDLFSSLDILELKDYFRARLCEDCNGKGVRYIMFQCHTCYGEGYLYYTDRGRNWKKRKKSR
jgi:RecJ-like exonuclease